MCHATPPPPPPPPKKKKKKKNEKKKKRKINGLKFEKVQRKDQGKNERQHTFFPTTGKEEKPYIHARQCHRLQRKEDNKKRGKNKHVFTKPYKGKRGNKRKWEKVKQNRNKCKLCVQFSLEVVKLNEIFYLAF